MPTIQGITRLPLLALSLAFIAGIALSAALPMDSTAWMVIAGTLLLMILAAPRLFRWLAVHRPGVARAVLNRLPPRLIEQASRALISPGEPGSRSLLSLAVLASLFLSLGALRFQLHARSLLPIIFSGITIRANPLRLSG
jgi:hypothetical protein